MPGVVPFSSNSSLLTWHVSCVHNCTVLLSKLPWCPKRVIITSCTLTCPMTCKESYPLHVTHTDQIWELPRSRHRHWHDWSCPLTWSVSHAQASPHDMQKELFISRNAYWRGLESQQHVKSAQFPRLGNRWEYFQKLESTLPRSQRGQKIYSLQIAKEGTTLVLKILPLRKPPH